MNIIKQEQLIPCYIINLKSRHERKKSVLNEFTGRHKFNVTIVEAIVDKIGAIGLWQTIKYIIKNATDANLDYVLICEDDHQFTNNYSDEHFQQCIEVAQKNGADVLNGGVSWFEDGFRISNSLFWVKKFSGTQFIVIFKKFFKKILEAEFGADDSADYKMSSLSQNVYFIHPFISVQKDFGYSDVTAKNSGTNRVEALFVSAERKASLFIDVNSFYERIKTKPIIDIDYDRIQIPAYVVVSHERIDRKQHIISQFEAKQEFDLILINDVCDPVANTQCSWENIRTIIQMAIDNDDDVIVICKDDHEFTPHYSKEVLLKNIIEAHQQGCDYLVGGSIHFDYAVPITTNRFWTNHCSSNQFIVLYRKFFQKILDESFDETTIADIKLSRITRNKMILYPFISMQHDFRDQGATYASTDNQGSVKDLSKASDIRIACIQSALMARV